MSNYPDCTWEGDPRAPWNEEDEPEPEDEYDDPRTDILREEGYENDR